MSDPLPITIELFFSNLTIASPIASMPSVTASILHSFRVTLISISLSIALYIASTGPVPLDVASSILLFELFFILIHLAFAFLYWGLFLQGSSCFLWFALEHILLQWVSADDHISLTDPRRHHWCIYLLIFHSD